MSKKWITLLVAAVIGAMLLPTAAFAGCQAVLVGPLTIMSGANSIGDPVPLQGTVNVSSIAFAAPTEPTLNAEGKFERILDVLVYDDDNTQTCFQAGNQFELSINGTTTSPVVGANVPAPGANLDVYDSAAATGLLLTATSSTAVGSGNTTQTIILVTVQRAGTQAGAGGLVAGLAGAAFRIKNIRVDAGTISGTDATWSIAQGPGSTHTITFDSPVPPSSLIGNAGLPAATLTLTGQSLVTVGAGTASSGAGLATQIAKLPNLQEGFKGAFRLNKNGVDGTTGTGAACTSSSATADTCVSGIANDIATVPTSLVFAVSGIPSGVTVTFPTTMSNSATAGAGAAYINWTSTSRSSSPLAFTGTSTSGSQAVVYDTTHNDPNAAATAINIESADNADAGTSTGDTVAGTTSNPNCKFKSSTSTFVSNNAFNNGGAGAPCDTNPKIGVLIGAQSAAGTATIEVAFGRGVSSLFTGDDVAGSSDIPAYSTAARQLVPGKNFFTINPIRTTLLFPFVAAGTASGSFNTGIEVASTGTDAGAFTNTTKSSATAAGGITFFFIGTTNAGAPVNVSLNTDLTNGGTAIPAASCPFANLDANGFLAAGKSFACGASALLALTGSSAPTSFSGYVIAVLNANYGHGFSVQFSGAGAPYAAGNALVLEQGSGTRGTIGTKDGGLAQ